MKTNLNELMLIVLFVVSLFSRMTNARLVAHFELDGNANDSVSNNIGIIKGNPTWVIGQIGGALSFDGARDCVSLGDPTDLKITGTITMAAWIKANRISGNQNILAKGYSNDNPSHEIFMRIINGLYQVGSWDGNNHMVNISGATEDVNQWVHLVGVHDGRYWRLYKNGVEAGKAADDTGAISVNMGWAIGARGDGSERFFNGLIDDVAIFDHALSRDEIAHLYQAGITASHYGLSEEVREIEAIIKGQSPKKAIAFLEKKIAEYEKSVQDNPSGFQWAYKGPSYDLYFLLARVKEDACAQKEDIASTYKRAAESGLLSAPRQGLALLWLHENVNPEEYEEIVELFIQNNSNYLREVATKAEEMVREQKSKAAVRFLEANLVAYTMWQQKHPFYETITEDTLPEIYFQLARAKEAAGASKEEIADAYSKTFVPTQSEYVYEWIHALMWLLDNDCIDECSNAIGLFIKNQDAIGDSRKVISEIVKYFQQVNDRDKFRWFLKTILTKAENPSEWAILIESCLGSQTNQWAKAYYTFLESKPILKSARDCKVAEQYVNDKKFKEAAVLYGDIINRCKPDDKEIYEFQLCKCLWEGNCYQDAVTQLYKFITTHKSTSREHIKEAMLMKGRAHVQLSEMDKAINVFLTLLIEYPESEESPEINFVIGYCYMLQGKYEEATEAFNLVIKDYPQSSYSNQANIYLNRINNMTD